MSSISLSKVVPFTRHCPNKKNCSELQREIVKTHQALIFVLREGDASTCHLHEYFEIAPPTLGFYPTLKVLQKSHYETKSTK
jgi:hypothetical protein